jgi:hypothetical protein
MNTDLISPSSSWTGQGTKVEQARALAEVYAMLANARESPRSEQLAVTRRDDACSRLVLAEKAFYRFPRDDQQVTGATVQLARELARCWGNINFGIKELLRDDARGQSEMMAEAWDIETSTRSYNVFIVPHKKDTKKGPKDLVNMRDIYENNANAGARRLRECLFAVLPFWFIEEATNLCTEVLENGADKGKQGPPLVERKRRMIEAFTEFKVTVSQLERKLDRPEGRWTAGDVATLRVIGKSLKAGETHVDIEFPREQTHASDVLGAVATPLPVAPEAEHTHATPVVPPAPEQPKPPQRPDSDEVPEATPMATKGHSQTIHARLRKFDYPPDPEGGIQKMADVSTLAGRPVITISHLTAHEANEVLTQLDMALEADEPNNALDAVLDARRQEQQQ